MNLHNHNLSPGKSFWKGFSKPTNIFIEVSVVAAVCPALFESLWPCLVVEGAVPDLGGPWAQKANPAEAQGWQLVQDQESLQRDAQEMKRLCMLDWQNLHAQISPSGFFHILLKRFCSDLQWQGPSLVFSYVLTKTLAQVVQSKLSHSCSMVHGAFTLAILAELMFHKQLHAQKSVTLRNQTWTMHRKTGCLGYDKECQDREEQSTKSDDWQNHQLQSPVIGC